MRKSLATVTTQQLLDLHRAGLLDTRPTYQRDEVWSVKEKKDFIKALLENLPVGSFVIDRRQIVSGLHPNANVAQVIDGQQRITTLLAFVGAYGEERTFTINRNGPKKFTRLDKIIQDAILNASFSVDNIDSATDNEIVDAFLGVQLGKNLTTLEKRNAEPTVCKGAIIELSDHEFLRRVRDPKNPKFNEMLAERAIFFAAKGRMPFTAANLSSLRSENEQSIQAAVAAARQMLDIALQAETPHMGPTIITDCLIFIKEHLILPVYEMRKCFDAMRTDVTYKELSRKLNPTTVQKISERQARLEQLMVNAD